MIIGAVILFIMKRVFPDSTTDQFFGGMMLAIVFAIVVGVYLKTLP